MASNNGSRGLFAGADIFKPVPMTRPNSRASGPQGNGQMGGPHTEPVRNVVEKNQTARFAPDSHGRTVTAKGQSGASNKGKGCVGYSPKVTVRKA